MTPRSWADTARLLRCTGFGATGSAVDAAASVDTSTLITQIVSSDPLADPGVSATPLPAFAPLPTTGEGSSDADRKQRRQVIHENQAKLSSWWTSRMLAVQQPFGERLTFAWHAIFATSVEKVKSASAMAAQNQRLRTLGRGDFRALALALLTDAAMVKWLDGQTNTKAAANENLSREFMELFTLGHDGGYTEADVREGARALTGWKIDAGADTTTLMDRLHDTGTKTVLGVTGNLGATEYCDAILAQKASAPFVLGRLWNQLVSDGPMDSATSDAAVAAYGAGRNLTAGLIAMLSSPGVPAANGTRVVSPVDWTIGLARAVRIAPGDTKTVAALNRTLVYLGQQPFEPPSVGGWARGQAWLSTDATDTRMQAARAIAAAGNLSPVADAPAASRVDAAAHLLGIASWSDSSRAALNQAGNNPAVLVAAAANTPEYLTL